MTVFELQIGDMFTEQSTPGYAWKLLAIPECASSPCSVVRVLRFDGSSWQLIPDGRIENMNSYATATPATLWDLA